MSRSMVLKISSFMKMTSKEEQYLNLLIQKERLLNQKKDATAVEAKLKDFDSLTPKYLELSAQDVQYFSDWTVGPLIEVIVGLRDKASFENILACFEEKVEREKLALQLAVLEKMGYLRLENGLWQSNLGDRFFKSKYDVPSKAVRKAHKSILERAALALEEQALNEREYLAKSFTIHPSKVELAKKLIREFSEEFVTLTMASDEKVNPSEEKQVYQLGIQFFRQAKILKK